MARTTTHQMTKRSTVAAKRAIGDDSLNGETNHPRVTGLASVSRAYITGVSTRRRRARMTPAWDTTAMTWVKVAVAAPAALNAAMSNPDKATERIGPAAKDVASPYAMESSRLARSRAAYWVSFRSRPKAAAVRSH